MKRNPFMVQKYPSYSLIVHVFCFTSPLLVVPTEFRLNFTKKKGKTYKLITIILTLLHDCELLIPP